MKKYYYTIGEVGRLLELKQHVIRYWETEFPQLHPRKEKGRNRKYSEEDIELLKIIKDMLYNQKYTIDGARQKLSRQNKTKKIEQMEFEFQLQDVPKQPVVNPQIQLESLPQSFLSKLHDVAREFRLFKEKWNIVSQTSSNQVELDSNPVDTEHSS